jgi:hypothetical protein
MRYLRGIAVAQWKSDGKKHKIPSSPAQPGQPSKTFIRETLRKLFRYV